jgi:RNA polymerase sigma-70 factor (ECF subfamily)
VTSLHAHFGALEAKYPWSPSSPVGAAAPFSPSRREHLAGCSLATLLVEAQSGSEDAFAELYRLTWARLHATVLRVVRSPELAGEVTQEVYLEIWQKPGRFQEDRGSALGWMMMIARRRAVDRVRSVTRALALERRYTERLCALISVDNWDDVTARLDAEQIGQTLAALSVVQREALTLVYLEQRPIAEVAQLLEIPAATVKSRMRDGLMRLRGLLSQTPPECRRRSRSATGRTSRARQQGCRRGDVPAC